MLTSGPPTSPNRAKRGAPGRIGTSATLAGPSWLQPSSAQATRASAKHRPESQSQPPLQAPPTAKWRQLLCGIGHGLQRGGDLPATSWASKRAGGPSDLLIG
jgi:hypothetical protein